MSFARQPDFPDFPDFSFIPTITRRAARGSPTSSSRIEGATTGSEAGSTPLPAPPVPPIHADTAPTAPSVNAAPTPVAASTGLPGGLVVALSVAGGIILVVLLGMAAWGAHKRRMERHGGEYRYGVRTDEGKGKGDGSGEPESRRMSVDDGAALEASSPAVLGAPFSVPLRAATSRSTAPSIEERLGSPMLASTPFMPLHNNASTGTFVTGSSSGAIPSQLGGSATTLYQQYANSSASSVQTHGHQQPLAFYTLVDPVSGVPSFYPIGRVNLNTSATSLHHVTPGIGPYPVTAVHPRRVSSASMGQLSQYQQELVQRSMRRASEQLAHYPTAHGGGMYKSVSMLPIVPERAPVLSGPPTDQRCHQQQPES